MRERGIRDHDRALTCSGPARIWRIDGDDPDPRLPGIVLLPAQAGPEHGAAGQSLRHLCAVLADPAGYGCRHVAQACADCQRRSGEEGRITSRRREGKGGTRSEHFGEDQRDDLDIHQQWVVAESKRARHA